MDKEELKTFLILKHGSLSSMFIDWTEGEADELSQAEANLLTEYVGVGIFYMGGLKRKNTQQNKV